MLRAVRHVANNSNTRLAAYSFAKLGAELSVACGGRHVGAVPGAIAGAVPGAIAGAVAGGVIGYTMSDQATETVDAKQIRNRIDARNMAGAITATNGVGTFPLGKNRSSPWLQAERLMYARPCDAMACCRRG
ncbi:MAG: hypothetical protein DI635_11335 [Pseudoxanthomonas suwonensis]|nr:MAG: hypothetical protein DI635_11335 [Pseudoxanthomonas suwonensis]